MNAADHFSLKELRRACLDFANSCIQCESVCALLTAAEKYIQYKSTKVLMQKVLLPKVPLFIILNHVMPGARIYRQTR